MGKTEGGTGKGEKSSKSIAREQEGSGNTEEVRGQTGSLKGQKVRKEARGIG